MRTIGKTLEIFLKLLGSLILGTVVLVLLPIALISGAMMRLPLRKLIRALLGIGAALVAAHELSVLLGTDRAKIRAKLVELLEPKRKTEAEVEVAENHDLVAALQALGWPKARAAEAALKSNPKADLAAQVKDALRAA